jgi:phage gp46-like protein
MLDKLQVSGVMKNYLVAIDNELKTFYDELVNRTKDESQFESTVIDFCDNVTATLDYYTAPIFNSGRNVIQKKLGIKLASKNDFTLEENDYIEKYKAENLSQFSDNLKQGVLACFKDRLDDRMFYDQVIEIIVGDCLKLFKIAQLMECKKHSINKIKFNTDDNSCSHCQVMSKFSHNVEKLINQSNSLHPFCKFSIDLSINVDNKINSIQSRLNVSVPDMITERTFKMVNDIIDEPEFILLLQQKFDEEKADELRNQVKGQISYFSTDENVLINKNFTNELEYIVTLSLLKDKLIANDISWWKDKYFKMQESKYIGDSAAVYAEPFINYIAEQNAESYFLESAIAYILQPKLLKDIDSTNYDKLKQSIFKGIEFLRG